ncbi:aminotransferase class IV [Staphylococcus americanisciuri]|uniref:Aminotransferase class IV n=1 Tax=Staphylococcus americanisciuri TaxID=2973940 RepID=A0ABT2F1W8_9STAP|nr:aminotransferase class IV [Staphylococcus americanisciuri]MCS4486425.1 aminotransferase class IV [Staphylococcus americanisciuri]
MQLFETMRLEAGEIPRETYHYQRMARSAQALGFVFSPMKWQQLIDEAKKTQVNGVHRLKVILSASGTLTAEVGTLADKAWMTARLVQIADDTPQWQRVNKTSERDFLQHNHQTDTVLFHDQHGKLLEFDIGNLVIKCNNQLCTPHYNDDFLRGCMRQSLLENGEIIEADITIEMFTQAIEKHDKIWMINSLREWVPVYFQ